MTRSRAITSPTERFRCGSDVLSTRLGDETVLLHLKDGVYYGLNEVGTRVWTLLGEQPRSLDSLLDEILAEFEVTRDRCSEDLLELAGELLSKNLIEPESTPAP